jgi:hypothetical protein
MSRAADPEERSRTVLTLESELTVKGLTGREITDFLLDPADDRYQDWWPGTHQAFHLTSPGRGVGHLGDTVLMDEYVGSRRVRMAGEVVDAVPGERVAWQLRPWGLRLPVRLTLTLHTDGRDVRVRHVITAGWTGRARALDVLWRLYLSPSFAGAMDRHVRTEFPLLRDLLHGHRPDVSATSAPTNERPGEGGS